MRVQLLCVSTLIINYGVYHYMLSLNNPIKPVPKQEYINVIRYSTLVSTDLLLEYDGAIFMGIRNNQPAKHYWFNPGVRLYKGETPKQGITRIFRTELGLNEPIHELFRNTFFQYKGCYEHFYSTNFLNIQGVSTQYFTHTYHVVLTHEQYTRIVEGLRMDAQHKECSWIPMKDIFKGYHKNRRIHPFVQQFFWNTTNRIDSFQGIDSSRVY